MKFGLVLVFLALTSSAQAELAAVNDHFAVWSPDGRSIAFTSDRSGDPEIYVALADGSGLRKLTDTPGRDAHPIYTPDGETLLFQSPRNDGAVRLFAMSNDGSGARQLSATQGFCGVPAPSPDGRHIAMMCSARATAPGQGAFPWRIFVMSAEGGDLTPVGDGPGNDQVPVWTPDGRSLVFFSNRSGVDQLYQIELDSGAVSALTRGPHAHRAASFTPDGEMLLMMRQTTDGRHEVRALNPESGEDRLILETASGFGAPVVSPDGRRFLFPDAEGDQARIGLADIDGSNRRLLEFRD